MANNEDSPEQTAEVLRYQVSSMLGSLQNSMPLDNVESFIAVGGDARFAVRQIGQPIDWPTCTESIPSEFDKLVERCEHWTSEEIGQAVWRSFRRGRDRQSGADGLPEPVPPDEGRANHRVQRDDARRTTAGTCQPRHGEGRPVVGGRGDPLGHGDCPEVSRRSCPCPNGGRRGPAAVRRDSPRPRPGSAPPATAARGGAVARGGRLREQSQPSQAQLLPDCQFGDIRARSGRDRAGCPRRRFHRRSGPKPSHPESCRCRARAA